MQKQKTVLVVDDTLEIASGIGDFLTMDGYVVLLACHGADALEKMSNTAGSGDYRSGNASLSGYELI